MRHIKHMGNHVLPALRDIAREFDLPGAFEIDPRTGATLPTQQTTTV
jgi:hypothetical protein